jgi:hypothetical protein
VNLAFGGLGFGVGFCLFFWGGAFGRETIWGIAVCIARDSETRSGAYFETGNRGTFE